MVEPFSRGYYLVRFYVEPYDGDRAVIERGRHEELNERVYTRGEGIGRLDRPLLMKLGATHFSVHGGDVPADTLALPASLLERAGIDRPPALVAPLLAKAGAAARLAWLFGSGDAGD